MRRKAIGATVQSYYASQLQQRALLYNKRALLLLNNRKHLMQDTNRHKKVKGGGRMKYKVMIVLVYASMFVLAAVSAYKVT